MSLKYTWTCDRCGQEIKYATDYPPEYGDIVPNGIKYTFANGERIRKEYCQKCFDRIIDAGLPLQVTEKKEKK